MTRIILPTIAALAVLVAIARLARRLERDALVDLPSSAQAPDDSEVVGMPTTWHLEVSPGTARTFFAIDWDTFFDTTARRN